VPGCQGERSVEQRDMWPVLLLLVLVELGCIGLWAATASGMPLLAALAVGVAIVYLAIFSGRD
jgi:hypothetical protein